MAIYDREGLIPSGQNGSAAQQALEAPHDLDADVRSTVETQYRQMEQAHDRIRAEELTTRLAENAIN